MTLNDMEAMDRIKAIRSLTSVLQAVDGEIEDGDTVLADILESAETKVTGQADEIFALYEDSEDREGFESLFETLTGTTFEQYLRMTHETLLKTLNDANKGTTGTRTVKVKMLDFEDPEEAILRVTSNEPATDTYIRNCIKAAMNYAANEDCDCSIENIVKILNETTNLAAEIISADMTVTDLE